jgi:isoleucyl-tRNA synthetase
LKFPTYCKNRFKGKFVLKEGNDFVISLLQSSSALIFHEKYIHKYPYDWRTKKPVLVRATRQWFADLTEIKEKAINSLKKHEEGKKKVLTCFLAFIFNENFSLNLFLKHKYEVGFHPETGRERFQIIVNSRDDWYDKRKFLLLFLSSSFSLPFLGVFPGSDPGAFPFQFSMKNPHKMN